MIHSFIHSGDFYSASSSSLLLRSAHDTERILCRSFTPKRHRQLRVKDFPKVPTWRLERYSNPQPFGRKAPNLPMSRHAPQSQFLNTTFESWPIDALCCKLILWTAYWALLVVELLRANAGHDDDISDCNRQHPMPKKWHLAGAGLKYNGIKRWNFEEEKRMIQLLSRVARDLLAIQATDCSRFREGKSYFSWRTNNNRLTLEYRGVDLS